MAKVEVSVASTAVVELPGVASPAADRDVGGGLRRRRDASPTSRAGACGGDGPVLVPQIRSRSGGSDVEEPEQLLCPITQLMFRDPVFVPESGNTYERSAVEQYWATSPPPRDPLTNVLLTERKVHPNWMVRREVQGYLDAHPTYLPQGWPNREVPSSAAAREGSGRRTSKSWGCCWILGRCALVAMLLLLLVVFGTFQAHFVHFALWAREKEQALTDHGDLPREAMKPLRASGGERVKSPRGSELRVALRGECLVAELPPSATSGDTLPQLFFAIFWLGFTGFWTYGAVSGGAPVIFTLFSLPFWGVGSYMLVETMQDILVGELLEVAPLRYRTCSTLWSWDWCAPYASVADLGGPPLRECTGDECRIVFEEEGARFNYTFGRSLSNAEAKWLQGKIAGQLPRFAAVGKTDLPVRIIEAAAPDFHEDYGI